MNIAVQIVVFWVLTLYCFIVMDINRLLSYSGVGQGYVERQIMSASVGMVKM
jgi:hypothetical protein